MKPASRNRFLRTTLAAAALSSTQAAELTTSYGTGADTQLSNDNQNATTGPDTNHGAATRMTLRINSGSRVRIPMFRFDLAALEAGSSLTDAQLRIHLGGNNGNRGRTVSVYGLIDETLDDWTESTITYNTAPGFLPAPINTYTADIYDATTNPTGKWQLLGTLAVPTASNTPVTSNTANLNLNAFLAADTNKKVTFMFIHGNDANVIYDWITKEDGNNPKPAVILPNATSSDSDGDGLADDWELLHFGNLNQSGTGDPDGDTFDNLAEQAAGSNPNLAASTPPDIDADGLPDLWEDLHFGNNDGISTQGERALQGASGDPDNDLNNNLAEHTNGTDPNNRNSFLDSDSDGLNDAWEIFYFGDLVTATSSTGDNDNDTHLNAAEYAANSNPNNSLSVPGDIDGDTLNDAWEIQYFGNINATNNPGDDPDIDGFTNKQEESSTPVKSNPLNAASIPGDSDGDGLPDTWEIQYFGDIAQYNGLHDPDRDGYTNKDEQTAGTDPADIHSFIDTDNDGLNDRWEIRYFGNLTTASNPLADPDNDSHANEDEYLAGSDPTKALSTPEDTDADGLNDAWELLFFPDIYYADGNDDNDRDFSTNAQEFAANTSPVNRAISPDTDFDGLGDGWEMHSFGNLTTTDDPEGDNDADSFNNAAEYAAGTHGNDPLSTPDTDGDGLPDGWEVLHFGDIISQNASGDPDGDGANNLMEYLAGTNPTGNASTPNPAVVTTAFGRGADTSLSNDAQNAGTGPNVINGAGASMTTRDNRASRLHIPMFRFDVSQLKGNLTNTALRLNVTFASPANTGTLEVFGLVDGDPGESWVEATTNYLNAPGIIAADRGVLNVWNRDPRQVRFLGTITLPAAGLALSNPNTLKLKSFIEADNDGQITLFLRASANRWYGLSTKDQNINLAPAIIAPLGEIVIPADIKITSVSFNTTANLFSMVATGLTTGSSYHIQSMKADETIFTSIPGSTFTGATDPQTITVTADEQAEPRQFFRIIEGSAP